MLVDTRETMQPALDYFASLRQDIVDNPPAAPLIYVAVLVNKTGQEGVVNMLAIFSQRHGNFFFFDIARLYEQGLMPPNFGCDKGLTSLFTDENVAMIPFDSRLVAPFFLLTFGVLPKNIHDLQLMEMASRPLDERKDYLLPFSACALREPTLTRATNVQRDSEEFARFAESSEAARQDGSFIPVHFPFQPVALRWFRIRLVGSYFLYDAYSRRISDAWLQEAVWESGTWMRSRLIANDYDGIPDAMDASIVKGGPEHWVYMDFDKDGGVEVGGGFI